MNGPTHAGGGNGRRIIIVVALGFLLVSSIVGWRYNRAYPPQPAAGPIAVQRVEIVADHSQALAELRSAHQQVVDELQAVQDRFAVQQAEMKKLSGELQSVRNELDVARGTYAKARAALDERPKRRRARRR